MTGRVSIGDFSRMTHLSVKALRLYHSQQLLLPATVDPSTGYRSYAMAQVTTAQLIRRYRDLGMPLERVKAVLQAPDDRTRDELISEHLRQMESQLEQTQRAVQSLRAMLAPDQVAVTRRSIPAIRVAAVASVVTVAELGEWMAEAYAEIYRTLRFLDVSPTGARGGAYATELFVTETGEATLFVPVAEGFPDHGRVHEMVLSAGEFAVAVHEGPLGDADRTYAQLGDHVAELGSGSDAAIREYYLRTGEDTTDENQLRSEICWPLTP